MGKEDFIIGVLGGMGTYATINLFEQYAQIFPAEKEWDRPRIIIDNHCTMPSRVRAILYNENRPLLVKQMSDSIKMLMDAGCNNIILGCNTSHVFLPEVYEILPEAEDRIINIIDMCVEKLLEQSKKEVYLLATEGTIASNVYQDKLSKAGIVCIVPNEEEQTQLRECIEAVKQNKYSERVRELFKQFAEKNENVILGCTELPLLYKKYKDDIDKNVNIYDPLELAIIKAHEKFLALNN